MNNRVMQLAALLQRLIDDENPALVTDAFRKSLGPITSAELAEAENWLAENGVAIEVIQRANEKHADLVAGQLESSRQELADQLDPGHPAFVLMAENKGLRHFIEMKLKPSLQRYGEEQNEKNRLDLLAAAEQLAQVVRHYERKENLLFPFLEKAGMTTPAKVMWGVDDIIRDLLRMLVDAVSEDQPLVRRIDLVAKRLLAQIEHMIVKEEEILLPMLLPLMTDGDWLLVARESRHIGYVFNQGIEGGSQSDALTWQLGREGQAAESVLQPEGRINLPSGHLTVDQLTAMLNTLPTDLTFADSDDIIRYFSEGKHQVFTRTRTIIGRDLYLCHPPQLVPVIRKLIDDFRNGRKDQEIVPVRKGSQLNLIRYYAVRDEQGAFIGTLEVTEEISAILDLVQD